MHEMIIALLFAFITGEDNLIVFSYSGRVKSPEWRWQRRRADLRHFEIFRHEPIIIYTRLPAWVTDYPICTLPASSECLFGISDAFSAFCLRVSVILPTCSLYPQQKRAYSALHPQAWTYIYRFMPEGSYRVQSPGFPKIVYCIRDWTGLVNIHCSLKTYNYVPMLIDVVVLLSASVCIFVCVYLLNNFQDQETMFKRSIKNVIQVLQHTSVAE